MRAYYNEVTRRLRHVNFSAIWPEFRMYPFALYTEEEVVLADRVISYDSRFLGNTAIDFDGQPMAIWNVTNMQGTEKADIDRMSANLVHEMFHAFQRERGEFRFPNDLATLTYPVDAINFSLRQAEFDLIAKAAHAEPERAKTLLSLVAASRQKRRARIGDTIECEFRTETVEGMAEYAGMLALSQLTTAKYEQALEQYCGHLRAANIASLDVRRMAYYSGTLLLLAAKNAALPFFHEIGREERSVFEILSAELPRDPIAEGPEAATQRDMHDLVGDYIAEKQAKFHAFHSKPRTVIEGEFTICGYDPMNMIRQDDELLCSHFIMLQTPESKEPLFLKGPVLLKMEADSLSRARAYYSFAS